MQDQYQCVLYWRTRSHRLYLVSVSQSVSYCPKLKIDLQWDRSDTYPMELVIEATGIADRFTLVVATP